MTLKGDQQGLSITIGKKYSFYSTILKEERPYWVYLPSAYDDTVHTPQSYPVLYLLDGDTSFRTVAGILDLMIANLQIPPVIMIALPNTDRTRDLTPTHSKMGHDGKIKDFLGTSGGGDKFLHFIKSELFPKVETDYRTLPYRLLIGHSFGGLLALHALLNHKEMFNAHVSIDPAMWWDEEVLTKQAKEMLSNRQELTSRTYISLANNANIALDHMDIVEQKNRAFTNLLEAFTSNTFQYTMQYFDSEDHNSVPLLSLYYGLLFIFDGHKPNFRESFKQPASLNQHFKHISQRIGIPLQPPENFVNGIGMGLLHFEKEPDKALEAFRLNANNYPESYNVYKSLAEAYEAQNETTLAIENYQKAIILNPDLQELKDKLSQLEQD